MNPAWSGSRDLVNAKLAAFAWFNRTMREEKKNKEKQNDVFRTIIKKE